MKALDVEAVQAFVLAADLQSFTRAAEALATTQSALSLTIKRREAGLGRSLLERTPRAGRARPFAFTAKWTLQALARVAGMSRSRFAVRLKDSVGEPAMDYLTRWRMIVASDCLANAGMSIAVVAPTAGYGSESAFGAAFERVIGTSPGQFARATAG
jgi:AraC-like DNA-binding protein